MDGRLSERVAGIEGRCSPRALVAHPGTQYAFHLAEELSDRGLLHRFWTGFGIAQDSPAGRLLEAMPDAFNQRFTSRIARISRRKLRNLLATELRSHFPFRATSESLYFRRNRSFQKAIPEKELESASVVIGFDTSSWILAQRARAWGKKFVLDQSIGHPSVKERVYATLRDRFRDWATSLPDKDSHLIALERTEHEGADLIVVPSNFSKATLVSEGTPEKKVRVIPFGTDLKRFYPSKDWAPPKRANELRFVFVGSLTARKGLPILLEAWRRLSNSGAQLWLAGGGCLPDKVSAELPDSVKLLGRQSAKQVAEILRAASVFVFPSFFEGLAQVQVEALASGVPVIGTYESGADEIIEEGANGFVLRAGEVESLADCLSMFIRTPQRVADMRDQVLRRRDSLSWNGYGDLWSNLLGAL